MSPADEVVSDYEVQSKDRVHIARVLFPRREGSVPWVPWVWYVALSSGLRSSGCKQVGVGTQALCLNAPTSRFWIGLWNPRRMTPGLVEHVVNLQYCRGQFVVLRCVVMVDTRAVYLFCRLALLSLVRFVFRRPWRPRFCRWVWYHGFTSKLGLSVSVVVYWRLS